MEIAEFDPILLQPTPDFAELQRVLLGQQESQRVHLVELLMDQEVMRALTEQYMSRVWIPNTTPSPTGGQESAVWLAGPPPEAYYTQVVMLYYRLGYDFVPIMPIWDHHPAPVRRRAEDRAELSRGEREWVDKIGIISSPGDIEKVPWGRILANPTSIQMAGHHMPPGMKLMVVGSLFEHVMKHWLGYEGLFYMLADSPKTVAEIFARWGQVLYENYKTLLAIDEVGGIFHGDDLGFKTGTMVSPDFLREHVFPWFKKYVSLAHERGKMFWLHSCGNLFRTVIDDLIDDVQIDAFHSFQDVILPVTEFKSRYGHRVATLGGVDVDCMARLDGPTLRRYIRKILDRCMPGGRYALGSGNSIANYIPVRSYLVMLDEARRWHKPVGQ